MTGSTVEASKALAAPPPKLLFRSGAEDTSIGITNKDKEARRQDPNSKLLDRIRDHKTLLPYLKYYEKNNTLLQDVKYIVEGIPFPDVNALKKFELDQVKEQDVPKALDNGSLYSGKVEAETIGTIRPVPLDSTFHLGRFGSKEEFEKLLKVELNQHIDRQDWKSATSLLAWVPNPQAYIEKIVESGYMDEFLLVLARSCSRKFRMKIAHDFAAHCISTDQIVKGITYYWNYLNSFELVMNELKRQNWWVDALMFSKLHRFLPDAEEDDEIFEHVVELLGDNLELIQDVCDLFGRSAASLNPEP